MHKIVHEQACNLLNSYDPKATENLQLKSMFFDSDIKRNKNFNFLK